MMDGGSGGSRNRVLVIRILWFGLTWAVVLYVLIAYLVSQQGALTRTASLPPAIADAALMIAFGVGILALAGAHFVGSMLVASESAADAAAPGWGAIQRATIVAGALSELPAIVGLVLFFLELPFARFLPFAAASLLCYALLFFRMQGWLAAQQAWERNPQG